MPLFEISKEKNFRILDFDIECRPLSWINQDYVSREITAIACSFIDEEKIHCWLLGKEDPIEILLNFKKLFDEAGMVTGHYIRAYDLPQINASMMENNLAPLSNKLSHDTKSDLIKRSGLSVSQENLAAMLNVDAPKIGMNQSAWRESNRLTAKGLELTEGRVVGDIVQHKALREELLKRKMLGPPRMWYSRDTEEGFVPNS